MTGDVDSKRYEFSRNKVNEMVVDGRVKVTSSALVWGPREFETEDGRINVTCKELQFLGGGVSRNLYTLFNDGEEVFKTENSMEILCRFYCEITGVEFVPFVEEQSAGMEM